METFEVNLEQIVWDLESRVNLDTENLKKSIQAIGLTNPLLVVGPDYNDKYYLIDGSRRYTVLKDLSLYNRKLTEITHPDIQDQISDSQRERLRLALTNINASFSWTWNKSFEDEQQQKEETKRTLDNLIFEETDRGYRFKMVQQNNMESYSLLD